MNVEGIINNLVLLGTPDHEKLDVQCLEGKLIPIAVKRSPWVIRLIQDLFSPLVALFYKIFPKMKKPDSCEVALNFLENHIREIDAEKGRSLLQKIQLFTEATPLLEAKRKQIVEKILKQEEEIKIDPPKEMPLNIVHSRPPMAKLAAATLITLSPSRIQELASRLQLLQDPKARGKTQAPLNLRQLSIEVTQSDDFLDSKAIEALDQIREMSHPPIVVEFSPPFNKMLRIEASCIGKIPVANHVERLSILGNGKLDPTALMGNFPNLKSLDLSSFEGEIPPLLPLAAELESLEQIDFPQGQNQEDVKEVFSQKKR